MSQSPSNSPAVDDHCRPSPDQFYLCTAARRFLIKPILRLALATYSGNIWNILYQHGQLLEAWRTSEFSNPAHACYPTVDDTALWAHVYSYVMWEISELAAPDAALAIFAPIAPGVLEAHAQHGLQYLASQLTEALNPVDPVINGPTAEPAQYSGPTPPDAADEPPSSQEMDYSSTADDSGESDEDAPVEEDQYEQADQYDEQDDTLAADINPNDGNKTDAHFISSDTAGTPYVSFYPPVTTYFGYPNVPIVATTETVPQQPAAYQPGSPYRDQWST